MGLVDTIKDKPITITVGAFVVTMITVASMSGDWREQATTLKAHGSILEKHDQRLDKNEDRFLRAMERLEEKVDVLTKIVYRIDERTKRRTNDNNE